MADRHAALPLLGQRIVGSAQQSDARPHCSGSVLRKCRQDGLAACVHQEDTEDTARRSRTGCQTEEGNHMKKMNKRGRIGSSFDDFLREDGIYEGVTARAIKRVLVRQLDELMRRE